MSLQQHQDLQPTNTTSTPAQVISHNPLYETNSTTKTIVATSIHDESIDLNSSNLKKTNAINQNISTDDSLWFGMPKMDNFVALFSISCSVAVIFGGLIPYIPQYLKIKRSLNSDGFSTYVCLTLLIANILRIAFWFGHKFELPLLIQSFVMIAGMVAMMELCIRMRDKRSTFTISAIGFGANSQRASNRSRRFMNNNQNGFDINNFWNWDHHVSYVKFLSLFAFILALLTYLLLDNYLYIEILGYVAVFTESMLGMPQLMRNYAKKSTQGMSVEMVIMWLSGDLFKTLYFIIRLAPTQFYVCGSIQVIVDILILYQVLWYRLPNVTYRKLPESN